ncbi:MAG: Hpt protein [Sphingobacteriaceae bacterium]|jgi:HPt (histidine-containing phosphotransfer) domain-containing protein|nr:Hpt protein [Sphingobacteriaceae bacterium]
MSEPLNPNSGTATLDLSYLNDVASGSTEFMIEMIDIFLEQTPGYFDTLTDAIRDKNWQIVADVAHKIKPTLAFMGVDKAKDDMQLIEHKARKQENLDSIEPEFTALKATCKNLFGQLETYKKDLESKL